MSNSVSTTGFKFVDRHLSERKWRRSTANGFPVFFGERATSFIETFESKGDNFCPHFNVIGVASGSCAINCRGCYLKGTYRTMRVPGEPLLHENLDVFSEKLDKWLQQSKNSVYSDGERCDALLYDGPDFPVSETLLPVFVKHKENGNRWLRLTKSANIDHLLDLDHHGVMILSYSLNPQHVSELFEAGQVATISERIEAARRAQLAGYPTRVRIDPVVVTDNWKRLYSDFLLEMSRSGLEPDVITLGTYRMIQQCRATFKMLDDEPAIDLNELVLTGESTEQQRLRYPDSVRRPVYEYLISEIKRLFPSVLIGICKETAAMRSSLGFTNDDTACNCTLF
jgi:spore photoproduct lyase